MRAAAIAFVWVLAGTAYAAKPLSRPHAHLDRSDECNSCHVAFGGVPVEKCRDCHRDIDERIKRGKGYHGLKVRSKACFSCHREHLGRGHQITPLDRRSFDHEGAGWPLSGGHVGVPCRECHTAKRKRTNRDSYLGASSRCVDCHGEYHGAGQKADLARCDRCHNTYDWKQLNANLRFNHERETRFPRTGRHLKAPCETCHLGKKRFAPIKVAGCVTCHQDPHPAGVFRRRICEDCHVTSSFENTSIFEHGSTGWALRGKHRKNKCADCHDWKRWKPRSRDCSGCHKDPHRGQFRGTTCSRCHQEQGFDRLKFNHNSMSRFALRGKHRRVACERCHPGGKYKPIERECRGCHSDRSPHADTFGETPCGNCHSPVSWLETRFDHGVTGFPLGGRHAEQPCFRCHPKGTETEDDTRQECVFCHRDLHGDQFEGANCDRCHKGYERWTIEFSDHTVSRFELGGKHLDVGCRGCHKEGHFRPIDTACGNCHQNFHEGQLSKACTECHSPHGWPLVDFDHDSGSAYALVGEHRALDCAKCHVRNDYKGLPQDCEGCHIDVHGGTRGAQCDRCHTERDWQGNSGQDHDFGAFRLEGVHDTLPCERCHGPDRRRELAGTGPECVRCHRDPHFGGLGPLCHDCHTQDYFLPSTFLHHETGFRLSGAHRFVECRECHPRRVFGGLPKNCDFCHTDTFRSTRGGACDHTVECPGGLVTCQNCHTTRGFAPARPGVACGTCESSR